MTSTCRPVPAHLYREKLTVRQFCHNLVHDEREQTVCAKALSNKIIFIYIQHSPTTLRFSFFWSLFPPFLYFSSFFPNNHRLDHRSTKFSVPTLSVPTLFARASQQNQHFSPLLPLFTKNPKLFFFFSFFFCNNSFAFTT